MKRTLLTAILAFIAILGMNAQEYEYTVKDTQISREEFFEAYQHRFEYNQIRDTTLPTTIIRHSFRLPTKCCCSQTAMCI